MRRLWIIISAILVLSVLFMFGSGIVLAEAGPFHPGEPPISPSAGCRGAEGFLEFKQHRKSEVPAPPGGTPDR